MPTRPGAAASASSSPIDNAYPCRGPSRPGVDRLHDPGEVADADTAVAEASATSPSSSSGLLSARRRAGRRAPDPRAGAHDHDRHPHHLAERQGPVRCAGAEQERPGYLLKDTSAKQLPMSSAGSSPATPPAEDAREAAAPSRSSRRSMRATPRASTACTTHGTSERIFTGRGCGGAGAHRRGASRPRRSPSGWGSQR